MLKTINFGALRSSCIGWMVNPLHETHVSITSMTALSYLLPLELPHLIMEVDPAARRVLNMPKMQARLKGTKGALSTEMMFSF